MMLNGRYSRFGRNCVITSGAVSSDLANMVNEAAIMAVKDGRQVMSQKICLRQLKWCLPEREKDRIW